MNYFQMTEPGTEVVIVDIVPPQAKMGPNTRYIYADIRDVRSILSAFDGCDEVYHLAGILGTSELIPISALAASVNIVGANNVLDACRIAGVQRVYNVAKPHFDGYYENAYTLTKHGGELLGQMYQQKFGMSVATVRWLNAVGPYQHLYPVRKFLPMMILLGMHGKPLEVYGDGSQTIDPIDTRDLSRFTVHACRYLGRSETIVDLGSGMAISCLDAASLIADVLYAAGYDKPEIKHIPMRTGEKEGVNLVADMSYWNSVDMMPEFTFRQSIRATVAYIQSLPAYHLQNALKFYGINP
jgi:UDP-glucose 4-epimerase